MRYCCGGLYELSAPSSTRPGKERHVSGVAVEVTANVGVTGLGIEEGMIGMAVEVGIGWIDGEQAVSMARSVSNVASNCIAWRVFIRSIIHRD